MQPEIIAPAEFGERIRLQLEARYRDLHVDVDQARFALRLNGEGVDAVLPLTPLYNECARSPAQASTFIARWVRRAENQLVTTPVMELAASRLLWCVRSSDYLAELSRSDELLRVDLGGGLVGFAAESLPGLVMRGVPRADWERAGLDEQGLRERADANTAARFRRLVSRIRAAQRVPLDGWRMSGDMLFQGSMLMVAEVLAALAALAGGDVLIANPDRSLVLAIPAAAANVRRFHERVLAAYREAMTPSSRRVLVTDGCGLREADATGRARRPRGRMLGWLGD